MPIPLPTRPKTPGKVTSKPQVTPLGAGRQAVRQPVSVPNGFGSAAAAAAGAAGNTASGGPVSSSLTMPPPGTYDPIIDSQVRASSRGLGDLSEDTILANSRANQDYATSKEQTDTQYGWSLNDLTANHLRSGEDLASALSRENEDYGTATSNLQRSYQNLGMAQAGSAAAHGLVGSGVQTGALAAALQARNANQGRDQSGLDTTHGRNVADNATASAREQHDYAQNYGRATTQQGWADSGLATDLQRGVDDRGVTLGRANRENNFYGQDAATEAMYQATSSGLYTPPAGAGPKTTAAKTTAKPKASPVSSATAAALLAGKRAKGKK